MTGWGKVKAAARYAGVSERTFRDWLKCGLSHSQLPSGLLIIRYDEIDAFLKGHSVDNSELSRIVNDVVSKFS